MGSCGEGGGDKSRQTPAARNLGLCGPVRAQSGGVLAIDRKYHTTLAPATWTCFDLSRVGSPVLLALPELAPSRSTSWSNPDRHPHPATGRKSSMEKVAPSQSASVPAPKGGHEELQRSWEGSRFWGGAGRGPAREQVTVPGSSSATSHRSRWPNSSSIKPANAPWTPAEGPRVALQGTVPSRGQSQAEWRRCRQKLCVLARRLAVGRRGGPRGEWARPHVPPEDSFASSPFVPALISLTNVLGTGIIQDTGEICSLPSWSSLSHGENRLKTYVISSDQECLTTL